MEEAKKTRKVKTTEEKLLELDQRAKELEEKKKAITEAKRKIEATAKTQRRKAEESVKYALGGLVLKLHRENGGSLVDRGEDENLYLMSTDKIVQMLPEPQRKTAKEMLKKEE